MTVFPKLTPSIVSIALIMALTGTPYVFSQEHSPEVQQLRQRVQALESLVRRLVDEQDNAPTAEFVPAVLTRETESPQPAPLPAAAPAAAAPYRSTYIRELLPEIGKIGAQIGLLAGGSFNPWKLDQGGFAGGYIDLPLKRIKGGKLSYEILVGLSQSKSDFETTSQVAAVANLSAGASLADALAGAPSAPFPTKRMTRTRLRLLEVSPVLFKYSLTNLDKYRIRPYLVGGGGIFVTITNQNPLEDESALFSGTAPFDAPLIGGQISQSPELVARGIPQGQGNIDFGLSLGLGSEVRLTDTLSLGVEYRTRKIAGGGTLQSLSSKFGFHW